MTYDARQPRLRRAWLALVEEALDPRCRIRDEDIDKATRDIERAVNVDARESRDYRELVAEEFGVDTYDLGGGDA